MMLHMHQPPSIPSTMSPPHLFFKSWVAGGITSLRMLPLIFPTTRCIPWDYVMRPNLPTSGTCQMMNLGYSTIEHSKQSSVQSSIGLSSSCTPLGAPSSPLKLPTESRFPLAKLPAAFLGRGTRVLDGAGCSWASTLPLGPLSSTMGLLSKLPGTSNDPRLPPVPLRSVGDVVFTGNLVWLRSRR